MFRTFFKKLLEAFGPPVQTVSDSREKDEGARAIAHAKDGYKNAQDIIKFIDAKSTFFVGSAVILLGFTLQFLKQYFEFPIELKDQIKKAAEGHPYCIILINGFTALSMLAGVLSIWSSIFSLVGRPPLQDLNHIQTILFPFFKGTKQERELCRKLSNGMTDEDIAREYECQLWNVGIILQRKLRRNRWAAWMFLVQIALLTAGGILLLFCMQINDG